MPDNPFSKHPTQIGETYAEHMRAASWIGFRMIGGGLACLVHAVFPFWFERTGSRTLTLLYQRVFRRNATADLERHPII